MDRSQIGTDHLNDWGSVTDLILRLDPNRRNLLYLTRRSFTRLAQGSRTKDSLGRRDQGL